MPKPFYKEIQIPSEVKYLYASLFDSSNAYFSAPEGVTVSIESKDESGTIKYYNEDTDTDSLYIQMNGKSLHKLCVRDPVAGEWRIRIQAKTNTPLFFQFQTVPTKDPHDTMRDTFEAGSLGSNIAYAGLANIFNIPIGGDAENGKMAEAIKKALYRGRTLLQSRKDLRDHYELTEIEKAIEILSKVANPADSSKLPDVLLVDANGDDEATKRIYTVREELLYNIDEFHVNYHTLIGEHGATRQNFEIGLAYISNLKLVSVAGHGNNNKVFGYLPPGIDFVEGEMSIQPGVHVPDAILNRISVNPMLVNGKIFHLCSCCSAANDGLGQELVANRARAFVGYVTTFTSVADLWMIKPDCTIDAILMEGKTVEEAVTVAKAHYKALEITHNEIPYRVGILQAHHDGLKIKGDRTARVHS